MTTRPQRTRSGPAVVAATSLLPSGSSAVRRRRLLWRAARSIDSVSHSHPCMQSHRPPPILASLAYSMSHHLCCRHYFRHTAPHSPISLDHQIRRASCLILRSTRSRHAFINVACCSDSSKTTCLPQSWSPSCLSLPSPPSQQPPLISQPFQWKTWPRSTSSPFTSTSHTYLISVPA